MLSALLLLSPLLSRSTFGGRWGNEDADSDITRSESPQVENPGAGEPRRRSKVHFLLDGMQSTHDKSSFVAPSTLRPVGTLSYPLMPPLFSIEDLVALSSKREASKSEEAETPPPPPESEQEEESRSEAGVFTHVEFLQVLRLAFFHCRVARDGIGIYARAFSQGRLVDPAPSLLPSQEVGSPASIEPRVILLAEWALGIESAVDRLMASIAHIAWFSAGRIRAARSMIKDVDEKDRGEKVQKMEEMYQRTLRSLVWAYIEDSPSKVEDAKFHLFVLELYFAVHLEAPLSSSKRFELESPIIEDFLQEKSVVISPVHRFHVAASFHLAHLELAKALLIALPPSSPSSELNMRVNLAVAFWGESLFNLLSSGFGLQVADKKPLDLDRSPSSSYAHSEEPSAVLSNAYEYCCGREGKGDFLFQGGDLPCMTESGEGRGRRERERASDRNWFSRSPSQPQGSVVRDRWVMQADDSLSDFRHLVVAAIRFALKFAEEKQIVLKDAKKEALRMIELQLQ